MTDEPDKAWKPRLPGGKTKRKPTNRQRASNRTAVKKALKKARLKAKGE